MAGSGETEDQTGWGAKALGFVVLLLLTVGVVVLLLEAFPHHVKNATNPNFVDNIVANPVVIFALRLGLLFGVTYVGISVVGLIGGRRWLSELGPFKASDQIRQLDQGADALEKGLTEALETIQELEQRLEDSDDALSQARSHTASLLDHIDTMEGQKEGK